MSSTAPTPTPEAVAAKNAGTKSLKGQLTLRIVSIAVVIALLFFTMVYSAGAIIRAGGFSISFDKNSSIAAGQISLSASADFSEPTVRLEVPALRGMTNISGDDIPADVDISGDGAHGAANYMAYTFYLRHIGQADCVLSEVFTIDSSLFHAEDAIRVTVYRNGTPTTYAKVGADGLPEYGTTPFFDKTVFEEQRPLPREATIKYTVVIWLEGNDPECLDNIKGGNVKMSLTFTTGEAADG